MRDSFWRNEEGATAAEFALVLGLFLTLIFATIGFGFTVWANETLEYAVQDAARCASLTPATCSDLTTVKTYALSHYGGPNISPTFAYSATGSCGHLVTATATVPVDAILVNLSIPLSASACFP